VTGWTELADELARWRDAGRQAELWWRDDDATRPTPPLDRLLRLAEASGAPLALAAIPAGATAALADRLAAAPAVAVLQHGWSHADRSSPGGRKAELADGRVAAEMLDELRRGRRRLVRLLPRTLPVLVPPWNRIAAALPALLPGAGFAGLSRYRPRRRRWAVPGLFEANCHVDPVDWRGGRGFLGEAAVLSALVGHLSDRRAGRVDAAEPTGLLTHHLQQDEAVWRFLPRLLERTAAGGARWLTAAQLFDAQQCAT